MKQIEQTELLQLQLDMLRQIDSFCRKENIEYFLAWGTGIGAVRHGGYIPWDDDIDIAMIRPNYDRFIKLFNNTYPNLTVYAPELDWSYYAPYANVCDTRTILLEGANGHVGNEVGIKIDVFPIDAVPSEESALKEMMEKSLRLKNYCFFKRRNLFKLPLNNKADRKEFIKILIWKILLLPWRYSTLQKKIHSLAMQTNWDTADNFMCIVFPSPNIKPCNKEVFNSYCDTKFESLTVRNITQYDTYLRSLYGDYMQLPPAEQRIAVHHFKAYWKTN